jgi:putative transposase
MNYAFMAQQHGTWPVAVLCEVCDMSRSGFSSYVQRQAAPTIERDKVALLARVQAIHAETRQSDGSRRMATQLQADGCTGGRYKARRVMRTKPA